MFSKQIILKPDCMKHDEMDCFQSGSLPKRKFVLGIRGNFFSM